MKIALSLALVCVIGCAGQRPAPPPATSSKIISLNGPGAKITQLNAQHKFVVLDFTSRVMPAIGTKLPVFRGKQRVGEIQITEPVRARFATADILEGDVRVGDEAR